MCYDKMSKSVQDVVPGSVYKNLWVFKRLLAASGWNKCAIMRYILLETRDFWAIPFWAEVYCEDVKTTSIRIYLIYKYFWYKDIKFVGMYICWAIRLNRQIIDEIISPFLNKPILTKNIKIIWSRRFVSKQRLQIVLIYQFSVIYICLLDCYYLINTYILMRFLFNFEDLPGVSPQPKEPSIWN